MKDIHKLNYHYTTKTYAVMSALGAFGSERKAYMKAHPEKNPLAGIDIDAEFERIQAKTSTVPRQKRDLVVFFSTHKDEIQKFIDRATEREAELAKTMTEEKPTEEIGKINYTVPRGNNAAIADN